ncbi:MAG: hypothetical protein IPF83_04035 [Rhodanobacteraceae bacterium]|nr:hypothetical protein [Rhodanobacteraceae bacterium]
MTPIQPRKTRNTSPRFKRTQWLGFHWAELRHASDYFELIDRCALKLIRDGVAFVCDLSAEEVREHRGTLTQPGRNSPFRDQTGRRESRLVHTHESG